jgi:post-segregation antitoxin (ccd killing protein)
MRKSCAYNHFLDDRPTKANLESGSRKRPVILTLSEDLVSQVRSLTDNLSSVVESLLSEYVNREQRERLQKSKAIGAAVASWNKFNSKSGSISDEYTTL